MTSTPRIARRTAAALAALASLLAGPALARAEDVAEEIRALRAQIEALDQKLRVLERKQENKDEESAAAAKQAPKVTVGERGFTFASADGAHSVRVRGLLQADSRWFFADGGIAGNDSFVLRRARLGAEGVFDKIYEFQLSTELAGSSATVLDANVGIAFSKTFQLRAGRFKTPTGIEQIQSDATAFFVERAFPSQLVANRDVGVQLSGEAAGGIVAWSAGLFNGVADGASGGTTDADDDKEFQARLLVHPFRNDAGSPLQGFGIGIGASTTRLSTAAGLTSGYRTDGQQLFFRFRSAIVADGRAGRLAPQVCWYEGPFGLIGEYAWSEVTARVGATGPSERLAQTAWQVAAGWVLTGEDASLKGVVPKARFAPSAGAWGAWEITGRITGLDVDDEAFPLFADPAANADQATAFGLGLNWYPARAVRLTADYFQTHFGLPASAPEVSGNAVLRQDEKAVVTRLQVAF